MPFPHLLTCDFVFCLFLRPTRGPSSSQFTLSRSPPPTRSVLFALQLCLWFFCLPPPPSGSASCFVVPPSLDARTSALHWSSGHGSPLCSSPVPSSSWGVSLGGRQPCQVGAHPSRPSPLFTHWSPLRCSPPPMSLTRPLTAALLLRVLSDGLPRARPVSRALSRDCRLLPCPLSCRRTWAASSDTPFRGNPLLSAPAGIPPISSLTVGRGGRYSSMRVIGMAVLCARCGLPLCCCWPSDSPSWLHLLSRSSPLTRALHVPLAPLCVSPASPPRALTPCHAISLLITSYLPSL